jgi:hypothetical protein
LYGFANRVCIRFSSVSIGYVFLSYIDPDTASSGRKTSGSPELDFYFFPFERVKLLISCWDFEDFKKAINEYIYGLENGTEDLICMEQALKNKAELL